MKPCCGVLLLPHLCSQQWLKVWTPDIEWKGREERSKRGKERGVGLNLGVPW